jgi:hypothetical protein
MLAGGWNGHERLWIQLGAAFMAQCVPAGRAHGEDHLDFRYEFYGEENDRIEVSTYSLLFEKKLIEAITAKGELIYDGISGASPTGSPPVAGSKKVPLAPVDDIRRAGNIAFDIRCGRQTLSPQLAYSLESDYESIGLSLNDAIEFNQKNTTLRFGIARSFDYIEPSSFPDAKHKDSWDFLLGVSQLLSPKTVLTADFTYGVTEGYLSDPYKNIRFDGWLPNTFVFPENRPARRTREVALLTLTQFIEPANASAEVSYRFHHDSFGVVSHTAGLTWHQKLGRRVVLAPGFRYYQQSEADFYYIGVPGLFPGDGDASRPRHYSADYRLSRLETFTYGVQFHVRATDWLGFDAGYQRYEMNGLDGKTSSSSYPKANIVNVGFRIWF